MQAQKLQCVRCWSAEPRLKPPCFDVLWEPTAELHRRAELQAGRHTGEGARERGSEGSFSFLVLALQTFLEERVARGAEIISLVLLSQRAELENDILHCVGSLT